MPEKIIQNSALTQPNQASFLEFLSVSGNSVSEILRELKVTPRLENTIHLVMSIRTTFPILLSRQEEVAFHRLVNESVELKKYFKSLIGIDSSNLWEVIDEITNRWKNYVLLKSRIQSKL